MFVCQKCGNVCGPNVSPVKVVTKTVKVEHPRREYMLKGNKIVDPGGQGTQIVTEETRCPDCAKGA